MKLSIVKSSLLKPLMLAAAGIILLANTAIAGGDSYTIFLNGKQVMKQYVTQPLSVSSLQLNNAANGTLVVYYSHCGQTGKGRSIAVKDDQGNVLKEWKFADATGSDNGMQLPVSEIAALQKQHANISLYYSALQLPGGRMLTAIGKHDKTTAALLPLNILASRLL